MSGEAEPGTNLLVAQVVRVKLPKDLREPSLIAYPVTSGVGSLKGGFELLACSLVGSRFIWAVNFTKQIQLFRKGDADFSPV